VSDYCLTTSEQFFSYVMARTSYILMRWRLWWWCPFFTKSTGWVWFL